MFKNLSTIHKIDFILILFLIAMSLWVTNRDKFGGLSVLEVVKTQDRCNLFLQFPALLCWSYGLLRLLGVVIRYVMNIVARFRGRSGTPLDKPLLTLATGLLIFLGAPMICALVGFCGI